MSTPHTPRRPHLPLFSDMVRPGAHSCAAIETLRQRAIELLEREDRALHTGELAGLLQAKTHEVHTALHHPHQTGQVRFTSSEGWSLPPAVKREPAEEQERLA